MDMNGLAFYVGALTETYAMCLPHLLPPVLQL